MRIPDDFVNSRKTNFSSQSHSVSLKCALNQHFSRGIHQFVIFFFVIQSTLLFYPLVKASNFPKWLCGRDFKIPAFSLKLLTWPYKKHWFQLHSSRSSLSCVFNTCWWKAGRGGYGCDCFRSIYTLKGMMWQYIVNTAFYATHWGSSPARLSMGIVFILVVVDTKRDTDTRLKGAIGKTNKRQALKSKCKNTDIQNANVKGKSTKGQRRKESTRMKKSKNNSNSKKVQTTNEHKEHEEHRGHRTDKLYKYKWEMQVQQM